MLNLDKKQMNIDKGKDKEQNAMTQLPINPSRPHTIEANTDEAKIRASQSTAPSNLAMLPRGVTSDQNGQHSQARLLNRQTSDNLKENGADLEKSPRSGRMLDASKVEKLLPPSNSSPNL